MGQITHLRNQFKSINTWLDIITFIRRRKNNYLFFWELNGPSLWNLESPSPKDALIVPSLVELAQWLVLEKIMKMRKVYRWMTGDQKSSGELNRKILPSFYFHTLKTAGVDTKIGKFIIFHYAVTTKSKYYSVWLNIFLHTSLVLWKKAAEKKAIAFNSILIIVCWCIVKCKQI